MQMLWAWTTLLEFDCAGPHCLTCYIDTKAHSWLPTRAPQWTHGTYKSGHDTLKCFYYCEAFIDVTHFSSAAEPGATPPQYITASYQIWNIPPYTTENGGAVWGGQTCNYIKQVPNRCVCVCTPTVMKVLMGHELSYMQNKEDFLWAICIMVNQIGKTGRAFFLLFFTV